MAIGRRAPSHLIDYVADAFRGVLRSHERDLLRLRDIEFERREWLDETVIRLNFDGRESCFIRLPHDMLCDLRGWTCEAGRHELTSLWWRCVEDHLLQRDLRRMNERYHAAAAMMPPGPALEVLRERLQHEEAAIRSHHHIADPLLFVAADYGAEEVTIRPGAVNMTATEVAQRQREAEYHARQFQRRLNDDMVAAMLGLSSFGSHTGSAAEARGLELLKANLTPEQRIQYDQHQHFIVTGSDTGKRYRINHGRQMNIDELDKHGGKVCGWCFLPEGGLVAGDVMLGQKIALENFERKALKIANRITAYPGCVMPGVGL